MYAIQRSKGQQPNCQPNCQPNILPCRVNHNGTVSASKRYWSPRTAEDGKKVSYFRGRKLHGKVVKIPKGYRGIIVSPTDKKLSRESRVPEEEDLDETEQPEDVGVLENQAEFDEVLVWGHETLPDESTDPYVRGIEEWIAFAEQIHSYPSPGGEASKEPKEP